MNKKNITAVIIIIVTNIIAYNIGSHSFIWGHSIINGKESIIPSPYIYNTAKALKAERELCNATTEMLHEYWELNDSAHIFFNEHIVNTESYFIADSIREGDWEDFYFNWYTDCE